MLQAIYWGVVEATVGIVRYRRSIAKYPLTCNQCLEQKRRVQMLCIMFQLKQKELDGQETSLAYSMYCIRAIAFSRNNAQDLNIKKKEGRGTAVSVD